MKKTADFFSRGKAPKLSFWWKDRCHLPRYRIGQGEGLRPSVQPGELSGGISVPEQEEYENYAVAVSPSKVLQMPKE
jgi:hypothetical protein